MGVGSKEGALPPPQNTEIKKYNHLNDKTHFNYSQTLRTLPTDYVYVILFTSLRQRLRHCVVNVNCCLSTRRYFRVIRHYGAQ